jgi:spore germination protein GerM
MKEYKVSVKGSTKEFYGTSDQIHKLYPDLTDNYFLNMPDVKSVEIYINGETILLEEV